MDAHSESHADSAYLCDSLFRGLSQRINDLQREKRQRWCCFFKPGCRRFAYVSHRKQSARLEVWFLGKVDYPDQYPTLDIRERAPTSGGFGQAFKARFYLDNLSQLPDAINLLYYVSYFLSYVQGTELTGRTSAISADKDDSALFNNTAVAEKVFIEGEKRAAVTMTRNSRLRTAAKKRWGLRCYCCGFDFEYFYGSIAKDFAVVHHLEPFSDAVGNMRESTVEDVRVVCANCHYVIHLETPPMDVDVLKERISQVWSPWSDYGVRRR